jgi:protein-S-isoprenylcysteine O-methyltransferase Ste14
MRTHFPALLIGIVIATYWLCVLYLAIKIRRKAHHPANMFPPGLSERIMRVIWIGVVALWIAIPLLIPFVHSPPLVFKPLLFVPALAWCCAAVALAALILTKVCWTKMGTSWRLGIDPREKTTLVLSGPYAYVRHPIYALSTLLMLATVVACPTVLMIVVAAAHLILLQIESRREEVYLTRVHGPMYLEYCQHVGRFFPMGPAHLSRQAARERR